MKVYNTLKKQKEELSPITPGKIKMYTCGQTVYNDIHVGNARFYVVFDAIRRYLEYSDYEVEFVQNFTDIDDKIIDKAREENCDADNIASRYITHTLEDLKALNVLPATVNPCATKEVPEIITLIQELISKDFAYENGGTVYYNVAKFHGYGKLSGKKIDELEAGARVEVEPGKESPMDFVLWKPAKPGEPKWDSPWGEGRPGWHIECSAMVRKYLGEEIDIHGGGVDLIFPHHENEIAQSEAVTGKDLAKCWIHCGILTTDHKKMSKSRGNFHTFREVAENHSPEIIRFYLLSGHYRMPMEFNDAVLVSAGQGLLRIKTCRANLVHALGEASDKAISEKESAFLSEGAAFHRAFIKAMDDDFNTADGITAIFELVKFINTRLAQEKECSRAFLAGLLDELSELSDILGIEITQADEPRDENTDDSAKIEELIDARQTARKEKNFAEADRIRDELVNMGIVLEDTPGGVRWRRA